MLMVDCSSVPDVLVRRPNAELGKKPPLSAPAVPPLPFSVKDTMARPLPAPAAKVGNSISSCIAEMYDWLVRLNRPVWSKLRVPTTQYAAPACVSGVLLDWNVCTTSVVAPAHSWPFPCATCTMLSPLVVIGPKGQCFTADSLALPHSSPSGIGPDFCGARNGVGDVAPKLDGS